VANSNVNQNQNINENTNIATTVATSTAEINPSGWQTYRNEDLGVSFGYNRYDQYSNKPHIVKVIENEITLYVEGNNFGHTITIFDIGELTPQEYIREHFMVNVDNRCRIDVKKSNENKNLKYDKNYLVLYVTSSDLENSAESVYRIDCGKYGNVNAVAYFLYNSEVKDKLFWVFLGQDSSLENYWQYLSSIKIFE
jgi:hypothetical protein